MRSREPYKKGTFFFNTALSSHVSSLCRTIRAVRALSPARLPAFVFRLVRVLSVGWSGLRFHALLLGAFSEKDGGFDKGLAVCRGDGGMG